VVVVGGLATRLYPISRLIPKALLPVGTKPILDYVVDELEGRFDEIWVVVSSHLSTFQTWASMHKGVHLYIVPTSDSVELGGVVKDIYELAETTMGFDDILLMWGNMVFTFDLQTALIDFYDNKFLLGLYDVVDVEKASRYGVVDMNGDLRVKRLLEKPSNPQSTLVHTGISVMPKNILKMIPEFLPTVQGKHHRFGDYVTWLLNKNVEVDGVSLNGEWFYIDWADSYDRLLRWHLKSY